MYLTAAEKNAFFDKYDRLIRSTVYHFKRRCSARMANEEDLYQECAIVLIDHINSANDQQQLHRIPVKDMVHAMCVYVLKMQAVNLTTRTTDFKTLLQNVSYNVDYSLLEHKLLDESIDDVLFSLDFEQFQLNLPKQQEEIISLKRQNFSNREIARTLGVKDHVVTRALGRVRRSYEKYQQPA